ncbi:MAG: polyketide synthase, partial [Planctomycetota bacterium]
MSNSQNDSRLRRAADVITKLQHRLRVAEAAARRPAEDSESIAVIGMGCRFPGDVGSPEALWQLLESGTDAITTVPPDRWDAQALHHRTIATPGKIASTDGGFLKNIRDFDARFFGIAPKEAITLDPQQRLLLETAWESMEHAGIRPEDWKDQPIGVFTGISSHDYSRHLMARPRHEIDAYLATGNAHSAAAGRLSYTFGFTGPSLIVDTACSSSLVAVHMACQSLLRGECSAALAGGVNCILSPDLSITFSQARMLSPTGRCKTFAASADGFVRAEGCGVTLLKRLSDAEADGNQVLAIIRGSAINQDGRSSGLTVPNGPSQQRVIRDAVRDAKATLDRFRYVEAHGTGTQLGDPIELNALAEVFS